MIPYILAAVGGYLIADSMKDKYAKGGTTPSKNYRTLLNQFEKEKPSIALGLISDDVASEMMRDKFSQTVQWEKLSDEEKKKYNEDYRTNLIEFRNYILKEFVKKYYSDEKVKARCKGHSRATIEAIKKEMTKIAETYPKEKY